RAGDELIEQLANGDRAAGAYVVDAARSSALRQQRVGAHRVADVGQIPPRVQIAHRDFGRVPPGFDVGDLPRESGRGERGILPGPDVVERARDGHLDAVARRAACEQLL